MAVWRLEAMTVIEAYLLLHNGDPVVAIAPDLASVIASADLV